MSPRVPNQCLPINFNIFNGKKYCVAWQLQQYIRLQPIRLQQQWTTTTTTTISSTIITINWPEKRVLILQSSCWTFSQHSLLTISASASCSVNEITTTTTTTVTTTTTRTTNDVHSCPLSLLPSVGKVMSSSLLATDIVTDWGYVIVV